MTQTPPTYQQTRWSLADLFPAADSSELEQAFTDLETQVAVFEGQRERLNADISSADFLGIAHQLEGIHLLASKINYFASLLFAEDTQNQVAHTLSARVDQFTADVSNRIMFFSLWWKDLDEANANRLLAESGDLRYWLEVIRQFKPHTLSEPEEKIINIKNVTGSSALGLLYDSLTNRFTFKLTVDGQEQELTRGELMVYVRHHDPALRAQAYQELYRVYGKDGLILGQIYQTLARDWYNENISLRSFESPIAVRNLINDIPNDVVDTLLQACQDNATIWQRYYRLKARWIGMERLRRYDIYAPVAKADKTYAFNDATRMVLNSFSEFDPRFAEMAERVFAQRHLDSEVRKGKRGGAFCATVAPGITPWVLLNYQGRSDDVATMAHELGHAIHSMLAAQHSIFTHHSNLPLAETASTFAEMVLVDKLLANESDEQVRRDVLFRQVDDAYATIMRQAYFALFERSAHDMIRNNASVDDLSAAYLQNLKQQFGEAVDVPDEFRWEWVSIPHIYNVPFYVYAYAFGQLLVLSLYKQFKQEGESFKPRYIKILSAGGSVAPVKLLSDAGIDVHSRAFWQGGFDVIGDLVSQLEALPLPRK